VEVKALTGVEGREAPRREEGRPLAPEEPNALSREVEKLRSREVERATTCVAERELRAAGLRKEI